MRAAGWRRPPEPRRASRPRAPCRPARRAAGRRMASDAIFISNASIFLPRYSGVRPTISPATKTATIANIEHAVEARADAAEDDLAELHQPHRHEAAERREGVVHRVDRAVRGGRRRRRPQRRVGDAEADLLAFHVAAGLQRRSPSGRRRAPARAGLPRLSAHAASASSGDEDDRHRGQQRPALPRVADHLAERVAQRGRDQQDREQSRGSSTAASGSRTGAPS